MGRKKKKRRTSRSVTVKELPSEIESSILSRLPVKFLMQLRCVCKRWCSMLSDPCFAEGHYVRSQTQPFRRKLLISLPDKFIGQRFFAYDYEQGRANPLDFLNQSVVIDNVSESVNGIVILDKGENLYTCNLSTREIISLPHPNDGKPRYSCPLVPDFYSVGYDPLTKNLKILRTFVDVASSDSFLQTKHKVFTVGMDLWRPIDGSPCGFPKRECVCVGGAIHFRSTDTCGKNTVVAFDVGDEKFRMIPLPDATSLLQNSSLIQYKGLLALIDYEHLAHWGSINMWILDDYKNQAWTEQKIALPYGWMTSKGDCESFFVSSIRDGEILITPRVWLNHFHVYIYHMETAILRKVEIPGLPEQMDMSMNYSFLDIRPIEFVEGIFPLKEGKF